MIIADTFAGSPTSGLNNTSPSTFSPNIVAAGGSGTWAAHTAFRANGTIERSETIFLGSPTSGGAARLGLGSYIWDAKGTENGLFVLTATFSNFTGTGAGANNWVGLGFFRSEISTGSYFSVGNTNGPGMATAIIRNSDPAGTTNYFAGPGNGNSSDPGTISGASPVTFTIALDLRSWNGTTDWGKVIFSNSQVGDPMEVNLTDDRVGGVSQNRFQYVGFSGFNQLSVTITDFNLTQIPEPSSVLALLTTPALLCLRRKR